MKRNGKLKVEAAVGGLWQDVLRVERSRGAAKEGKIMTVLMLFVMIVMIRITITRRSQQQ